MSVFLYLLGAVAVFGVAMYLLAGANKLLALKSFSFRAEFKGGEEEHEERKEKPRLSGRRGGRFG